MADFYKKKKNPTTESMKTISKHISDGSFSRVYLLYGDETYLINQYRDMLIKALVNEGDTMNFTSYTKDTFDVNSVISDIITMPFLAEHRVVLAENTEIFDGSDTTLLDQIGQMSDTNVLIFCEQKVDKRKKLYTGLSKLESASCLEFQTPEMDTLIKWVGGILSEDGLRIKADVPDKLIAAAGTNMNMLRNEANKLHDYCLDKGEITGEDVELLCKSPIEDKIFEMCDAISRKNKELALKMFNDLEVLNTAPMTVIVLVTRQYNLLVQVSQMLSEHQNTKSISSGLKTPEFVVRKLVTIAEKYNHKELLKSLDLCHEANYAVKTGKYTDKNAAENLIINLML